MLKCFEIAFLASGLQYEDKLSEQLEAAGLSFWTEEALRSKGFFKTPDAKLQVGRAPLYEVTDSFILLSAR